MCTSADSQLSLIVTVVAQFAASAIWAELHTRIVKQCVIDCRVAYFGELISTLSVFEVIIIPECAISAIDAPTVKEADHNSLQ